MADFRKSSFCAASECVEVAADSGGVLVRDSLGGVLRFTPAAWRRFTVPRVAHCDSGALARPPA